MMGRLIASGGLEEEFRGDEYLNLDVLWRVPNHLKPRFRRSLSRFVRLARSFFKDKLHAILVFGSLVNPTKEVKEDSDIDLVVVHSARPDEVELFHKLLPTERRRRYKERPERDGGWSWYYDEPLKHDAENDVYWHIFYVDLDGLARIARSLRRAVVVYARGDGALKALTASARPAFSAS